MLPNLLQHALDRKQVFEHNGLGAEVNREDHVRRPSEGMEHRQHAEHAVFVGHVECDDAGLDIGDQVALGEHHALGQAGRAGGVDQEDEVVGRHFRAGRLGERVAVDLLQRRRVTARIVQEDVFQGRDRLLRLEDGVQEGLRGQAALDLGVVEDEGDALGFLEEVHRHRYGAEPREGEGEDHELGAVTHQDAEGVALADAELGQAAQCSISSSSCLKVVVSPLKISAGLSPKRSTVLASISLSVRAVGVLPGSAARRWRWASTRSRPSWTARAGACRCRNAR